nr:hypothetical protein Iba_chr13fCG8820 [Ipomoea batatas]
MQPYEEENTEDTKNKILAIMEEFKQDMANMREEWRQEHRQRTSSLEQETQASSRTLEDQMAQVVKYMTSENNCIIEDVDNACVEMPSDEIGVKEHDNFCDEPYDDSFDHNCGDAYIENVVGNVDCVVDNVHANPLENVGNINARRDDDNCDNSSNACKNATYDLHDRAFICGNEFWVTNEVIFLTPCNFNDNDSFDFSDDDDENCVDTCENNSFNSMENNSIESCVDNFSNCYDSNSSKPCENNSSVSLEDNDGLESFTFDDNALINENDDKLHVIVCGDDNVHDDANVCELNDVEFVNFFDDCIDDAMYVHEFLGEVEEEMDGSERDVLLNSEKERENEKQEIMVEGVENENNVLESFTFGDESLSNKHVDDLHEMLCGGDDMNIEASLCDLSDIECVTFHDNCLDDALYIHDLIGVVWGCEGDALLYFV